MSGGPLIDFADAFFDHRMAQVVAQPHRPQADHRMRLPPRGGAGDIGLRCFDLDGEPRHEIFWQKRRVGRDADDISAIRAMRARSSRGRLARRPTARRNRERVSGATGSPNRAKRAGSPLALSTSAATCGRMRSMTRSSSETPPSSRNALSPPPMRRDSPPASSSPTTFTAHPRSGSPCGRAGDARPRQPGYRRRRRCARCRPARRTACLWRGRST